ncbi:MAG: peptidylprolyl isomerase [archaeon]
MKVKKGDKIKVEYTGTFDDGKIFDSSLGKQPLEFEVGVGQVIKGFDEALIGMEKGEEKDIKIKPKDAYGEPKEELIKKIPKDQMPKEKEMKKGMILVLSTPTGQQFPAVVKDVSDKEVTLDLNHPLAGKNLNFKFKIIEITSS